MKNISEVYCYFSSHNNITEIISQQLNSAKNSIYLAMYTMTDKKLIDTLIEKRKSNVSIHAIFDEEQITNYNKTILNLNNNNIYFRTTGSNNARMHHKFVVIDNYKIITGSFNWTVQANIKNYENIIIIENPSIADSFQMEFHEIWDSISTVKINQTLSTSSNSKKSIEIDKYLKLYQKKLLENRNLSLEDRNQLITKIYNLKNENYYTEALKLIRFLKSIYSELPIVEKLEREIVRKLYSTNQS